MLATRVIPTLLLRSTGLVKGKKYKNHRYVGDPINAVKIFNEKEVDEIIFLDISATPNMSEPNYELIEDIASQAFMPFAYGGGIYNVEQIQRVFSLGVEKVIINTAATKDLNLIAEASALAGSQSIVACIDLKKNIFGKYKVMSNCGRKKTNLDPVSYAEDLVRHGVGEIMVCSVDSEGSRQGYDLSAVKLISDAVDVPVIASGGAGKLSHFKEAKQAGASAVAAGSMFVFHGKHEAVLITYPEYEMLTQLFKG